MDTELARTFLAVIATGSFNGASQRLCVTQSTVSARIQRLEESLGAWLFSRTATGIELTSAGKQFQRHASALTRTVELARQEIGAVGRFRATLTVGGRIGLWDHLLQHWLQAFAKLKPDIAVRALVGFKEELMQALIEGRADLAIMYTPQARPGLRVEPLLEETLVLVATRAQSPGQLPANYVYVDWGPEFFAQHSLAFANFTGAALTVNIGMLGLEHILKHGGSGYFPLRLVRQYILAGKLHRIAGVPDFRLPGYLCFPAKSASIALPLALQSIRSVVAEHM